MHSKNSKIWRYEMKFDEIIYEKKDGVAPFRCLGG